MVTSSGCGSPALIARFIRGFSLQQKVGGNKAGDLRGRSTARNGAPAVFVPFDIGFAIGLAVVHRQSLAPALGAFNPGQNSNRTSAGYDGGTMAAVSYGPLRGLLLAAARC
jgi:hypothetical protein